MVKFNKNTFTDLLNALDNKYRNNIILTPEEFKSLIIALKKLFSRNKIIYKDVTPAIPATPATPATSNKYYPDPIEYNQIENGNNYKIFFKQTDKKKIISEAIFRTKPRNDRLPEYFSGLLCNVNRLPDIMGDDWGYRLYYDQSILAKNMIYSNQNNDNSVSNYNYDHFNDEDKIKYKNLFENKDEGQIFLTLLSELDKLPFVELYNISLNEKFIDSNGYIYNLFGTNFRYHASLDKTKDLVYMKDVDTPIDENLKNIWSIFEKSDKSITHYLLQKYKPPSHHIVQYPFTILAYFWGIKPNKIDIHYNYDDILDYLLNYENNNNDNIFLRDLGNKLDIKSKYGSDEIVLTDLIFSEFDVKDTLSYFSMNPDDNIGNLWYIFYYAFKDNIEFKNILQNKFNQINKEYNLNFNNLDEYLFGTESNKFCCIFPFYNKINDELKKLAYLYYLANQYTIYDLCTNQNSTENFRNFYIKQIAFYIRKFDSNLNYNDDELYQKIFYLNQSDQFGFSPFKDKSKIVLHNYDYLFNYYYSLTRHYKDNMKHFIYDVINETRKLDVYKDNITVKNFYELLYKLTDNYGVDLFSKGTRDYQTCTKLFNLTGGYKYYIYDDINNNRNCIDNIQDIVIKKESLRYNEIGKKKPFLI